MIKTIRYEVLVSEVDEFIELMRSLGIRVSKHSKIEKISRLIKELIVLKQNEQDIEGLDGSTREQYIDALFEADDFIELSRSFPNKSDSNLLNALSKALNGPFPEKLETLDTSARDALFELIFASILKKAGLQLLGFDDVKAMFTEKELLFECKRLSSERKVEENIKIAINQLTKKLRPGEYGCVVLSIEKVMDIFGRKFELIDEASLHDFHVKIGAEFLNKYRSFINQSIINIQILGVIIICRSGHILKINPRITKARFLTFYPVVSPRSLQAYEYHLFRELCKHLAKVLTT